MVLRLLKKKWTGIAKSVPGRSPEFIRFQWIFFKFQSKVLIRQWTAEEDAAIFKDHALYGNKCTNIVKSISVRTADSIQVSMKLAKKSSNQRSKVRQRSCAS